jgi:hypothetical protein
MGFSGNIDAQGKRPQSGLKQDRRLEKPPDKRIMEIRRFKAQIRAKSNRNRTDPAA